MLIIGFTRDEGNDGELTLLRQALDAIKEEIGDWEENFEEERFAESYAEAEESRKLELGRTSLAGANASETES